MTGVLCAKVGAADNWFPDARPGTAAHAVSTADVRRLCLTCPGKAGCHDSAMTDRRTVGIFAGLDEVERRRLHRDGGTPDDYGYCSDGLHLAIPENTGTKGNCLPCRRIKRAERAKVAAATPFRRRNDGRFAKTADLALDAAA